MSPSARVTCRLLGHHLFLSLQPCLRQRRFRYLMRDRGDIMQLTYRNKFSVIELGCRKANELAINQPNWVGAAFEA